MYLLTLVVITYMTLHSGVGATDVVTCEHGTLKLECTNNEKIQVYGASYGRLERTTCRNVLMSDIYCNSTTSFSKTVSMCNGKPSCNVPAKNSVFGDPCVGTFKYLRIGYNCIKAQFTKVTCEGGLQTLSCPHNWRIRILSANYGRTQGREVCPSSAMKTTSCFQPSSLSKVQKDCNGKTLCKIYAKNSVFGDPCVGTYKYLATTYECSP